MPLLYHRPCDGLARMGNSAGGSVTDAGTALWQLQGPGGKKCQLLRIQSIHHQKNKKILLPRRVGCALPVPPISTGIDTNTPQIRTITVLLPLSTVLTDSLHTVVSWFFLNALSRRKQRLGPGGCGGSGTALCCNSLPDGRTTTDPPVEPLSELAKSPFRATNANSTPPRRSETRDGKLGESICFEQTRRGGGERGLGWTKKRVGGVYPSFLSHEP
ncbi:hypothetical protein HOY80DRAFT_569280 [Tuber brumale]|nr:hypothetical protein HOY80DRAFT_569280 [Tuber brumale]